MELHSKKFSFGVNKNLYYLGDIMDAKKNIFSVDRFCTLSG